MEKAPKKTAPRKKTTTASTATRTRKTAAPASSTPTHEQIAARAHELFLSSGEPHGRDVEFWLEAERQLREGVKV